MNIQESWDKTDKEIARLKEIDKIKNQIAKLQKKLEVLQK